MAIHHLDCASMHPPFARLIHGTGSWLGGGHMVGHCLLIESADGLVLVDAGFGLADVARPVERLGRLYLAMLSPKLDPHQCAIRQVEALGYRPADVRHIVLTHMDFDHAGGIGDFPDAKVHVYRREQEAALRPRGRLAFRYRRCQWGHHPDWVLHETDGERFMGFDCVQAIVEPEVLLVPLLGHSPGHAAVAVRQGDGWLLHCGDAYYDERELSEPARSPVGVRLLGRQVAQDKRARLYNLARLRRLRRDARSEVQLFSAHDAGEFARLAG